MHDWVNVFSNSFPVFFEYQEIVIFFLPIFMNIVIHCVPGTYLETGTMKGQLSLCLALHV